MSDGEDYFNQLLSLDNWPNNNSSMELENESLLLSPNHNNKKLSPMRISGSRVGSSKRKQPPVSRNLSKGKGLINKRRRTFTGNSAPLQKPEPKGKEGDLKELIQTKSVEDVLKIFKDRIGRRKKKVEEEFTEAFMWLINYLVDKKQFNLLKETIDSQPQIRERWQSDLQKILDRIQEIRRQVKSGPPDVMTTATLLEIGTAIERPNEQVREFLENLKSLEMQQGVCLETQREKLFSGFPLLFHGEISTNGPTADQDQENLQTQEQLSSSISPVLLRQIATNGPSSDRVQGSFQTREHDDMPYTLKECVEKLFAKDNNKVELPHFQKEMENQKDLEPIVGRIKQERGMDIEYEFFNIQLLVCAAFKQMEDVQVKELKWDILLKWGAVLNRAKELGFEVKFVHSLLEKKLASYFLYRG